MNNIVFKSTMIEEDNLLKLKMQIKMKFLWF